MICKAYIEVIVILPYFQLSSLSFYSDAPLLFLLLFPIQNIAIHPRVGETLQHGAVPLHVRLDFLKVALVGRVASWLKLYLRLLHL